MMTLKRNGFVIEVESFGRGQWTFNVISKDGESVNDYGVIEFAPKTYAMKAAKHHADHAVWVRGLGYCIK